MGWDAADERLPGSPKVLRDLGVQIRIERWTPRIRTRTLTVSRCATGRSITSCARSPPAAA